MIHVIKNPCQDLFYEMIASSQSEISLCAPFVKTDIVNKVLQIKNKNVDISLITNSNLGAFASKGSDLEAIKSLLNHGYPVYNYQNLHAKIYLFDSNKAIVTSANLTFGGLVCNYEYGILIENDINSIGLMKNDYNSMIKSKLCGAFDNNKINQIEKTIADLGTKPKLLIDFEGDIVLTNDNIPAMAKQLHGWQKEVFIIISGIAGSEFTNQELLSYIPYLKEKYPHSKTPDRTLSRVLQELRDMGFVKFEKRGNYKKLWDSK